MQRQNIAHTLDSHKFMMSSNGKIFCVTGHLCGEFTGHRWIPHTKASDAELWCFLWINGWVNTREAGDLGRHHAHYDIIVMCPDILPFHVVYCVYFEENDWPYLSEMRAIQILRKYSFSQYCSLNGIALNCLKIIPKFGTIVVSLLDKIDHVMTRPWLNCIQSPVAIYWLSF